MTDADTTGGLKLEPYDDRLPWLEPAVDEEEDLGVSPVKIVGLVLVGLILLGLIVGGGWWLKNHYDAGSSGDQSRLIAAPGGDYKIPANEADARVINGTGDASYATSEGVDTNGRVDASRLPEAPLPGVSRGSIRREDAAAPGGRPGASVTANVRDETHAPAAPRPAAATTGGVGGAMIQLGAYGSEAVAQDAWKKLSKRFDYLAALGNTVQRAEVGGATVYRLRASAGSASNAAELCGRLKVAGENCIVVK